ncbi:hypothetical protein SUGI_0478480 [Cryptomeria japonica]|nr:hypothetical protein SUGI_0478480 [Cryptomeria japonica]
METAKTQRLVVRIKAFVFLLISSIIMIMAYIILSSASAGTAWIMLTKEVFQAQGLYGGAEKKFLKNASISVSIEFLGFIFMAASAAMSTYSFFCYLCSKITNTLAKQEIPATNDDSKQQSAV